MADGLNPDVALKVGGQLNRGWVGIEVTRSIEAIAGSFRLTVTDRWPGLQAQRQVQPGDACALLVDGETVITGWLDDTAPQYDAEKHEVAFTGRDATGDLVDCSAVHPTGTWGASVPGEQIIAELTKPFGIAVKAEVDAGIAHNFALQAGETVFEAIERICRMAGVLPVSDGMGGLLLTRGGAGGSYAPLVLGRNILKGAGTFSNKQRYSEYIVHSQMNDFFIGSDNQVVAQGTATDPGVKRYRPLVIIAEYPNSNGDLNEVFQRRATWESTVRAGRARRAVLTVAGWRDDNGKLWHPNGTVPVTDPFLGFDNETLVIAAVKLKLDETGTTAELTVNPPAAFQLTPLPESFDYAPVARQSEKLQFPPSRQDSTGRIAPPS
ncbi:MAG TPA: hypothetical protein VM689_13345 [Aliidongia sp.]|nr:hypothetical protein [Aliidongia sp.]